MPRPHVLVQDILSKLVYKPGWSFTLTSGYPWDPQPNPDGFRLGLLSIQVQTTDSFTGEPVILEHNFTMPDMDLPREAWERMILDHIIDVEIHEAMEFFTVDGEKPFFPDHRNPYVIPDGLFLGQPAPLPRQTQERTQSGSGGEAT